MPHALSAVSSAANAPYLASEANALHVDCVTKPLSEHLPGLLRTGIPYPIEPRQGPLVHCPVIRSVLPMTPRAKHAVHELSANRLLVSWFS
jgi:hypothetical protein